MNEEDLVDDIGSDSDKANNNMIVKKTFESTEKPSGEKQYTSYIHPETSRKYLIS
jgi:hypothetical protein